MDCDAAEVVYKNMNVWADLSGLVVGRRGRPRRRGAPRGDRPTRRPRPRAFRYAERPNRFLYGSDWPLAPMPAYRDFVRAAVPDEFHELVFADNARVLFGLPE